MNGTKNARRSSQLITKSLIKTILFWGVFVIWPKSLGRPELSPKCILTVDNVFKRSSENILCPLSMLPNAYRKNPAAEADLIE